MNMNSKIEVKTEAVRLAALVEGANVGNVVELSKKKGNYLLEGVDMPDVYDQNEMMKTFASMALDFKPKDYGENGKAKEA